MSLRQRQSEFAYKVGLLIQFVYDNGYELTLGDAWAMDNNEIDAWLETIDDLPESLRAKFRARLHKKRSFHYRRLAIDINLFKDGKYLSSTKAHIPSGEYWESLGGTWGGRFKKKDGNHYSWGE